MHRLLDDEKRLRSNVKICYQKKNELKMRFFHDAIAQLMHNQKKSHCECAKRTSNDQLTCNVVRKKSDKRRKNYNRESWWWVLIKKRKTLISGNRKKSYRCQMNAALKEPTEFAYKFKVQQKLNEIQYKVFFETSSRRNFLCFLSLENHRFQCFWN